MDHPGGAVAGDQAGAAARHLDGVVALDLLFLLLALLGLANDARNRASVQRYLKLAAPAL